MDPRTFVFPTSYGRSSSVARSRAILSSGRAPLAPLLLLLLATAAGRPFFDRFLAAAAAAASASAAKAARYLQEGVGVEKGRVKKG